jgi:hypothetical protein
MEGCAETVLLSLATSDRMIKRGQTKRSKLFYHASKGRLSGILVIPARRRYRSILWSRGEVQNGQNASEYRAGSVKMSVNVFSIILEGDPASYGCDSFSSLRHMRRWNS